MSLIANYTEQRLAFDALLQDDCCKPILLYKGESGSGKSTLMGHCRTQINNDFHHALVGLSDLSVMQFFYQIGRSLGWQHFDGFKAHLNSLNKQFDVNLNDNTQSGMGNRIRVELNAFVKGMSLEEKRDYYSTLTHVWSEDINNLSKPCVLLLDVYEKTPTETQHWLVHDFLSCAAYSEKMRVVVAGQSVPENINWNNCCETKKLEGIHQAEEWLPVIRAMQLEEPPLKFLQNFCVYSNGRPSEMLKFINAFSPLP
jgi:hypothetical protein